MAISLRVYPSVVYIDTASYSESGFIFIGEDGGSAITSVSIQSYTTDFQLMSTEGVVDRYRLRAYLTGNTDDQTTVKLNVTTTAGSGTVLVTVVRGLPQVRPFQLSWDKLSYLTSVRLASDATSAVLYNVSPYPFVGGFEVTGVTGVTNGVPTGSSWVVPITTDEGSISIKDAGTSEVGRASWVRVEAEDVYANPTAVCGYAEVSAKGGSTPLDITVMQQVTHPDGSIETLYPTDYVLTATLLTSGISGLTVDNSTGRVTWPANGLETSRSCQVSVKVVANGLSSPTYTVTSTQKANVPEYSKPVVSGISYPDVAVSWRGGSQTPTVGRITQHVVYTNGTEADLVITDYTMFSILPTEAQHIATMLDNGTTGVIEWTANDTDVERSFDVRFFITANGVMSDVVLVPSRQERGPIYSAPTLDNFSYDDIDSDGGVVYSNYEGAYRDVEYADGSTERIQLSSASFTKVFAITSGSGARVNAQTGALTWATYTGDGIREIEVTATLTMNDGSGVGETVAVARQTPSADYDAPVIDSVTYANVDGDGGGSSPVIQWHQGVTYWDGSSEVLSGTRYAWDISSVSGSPTPEYADDGTVYLPANDTFSTRIFSVVGSITLNGMTSATYTAKVSQWGRSGYFRLTPMNIAFSTASASAGSESKVAEAICYGDYSDGMGNTTTNIRMTWRVDYDIAVDSILSGGDYLESWSVGGLVWKENTSTESRSVTVRVYATTVSGDPRVTSNTRDIIVYQSGTTAVDPDPDKQVLSYDIPVVTGESYPDVPYGVVQDILPTFTVTQKVNYTDGSSEVLTLGAGQYSIVDFIVYTEDRDIATVLDRSTGLLRVDTTNLTEDRTVDTSFGITGYGGDDLTVGAGISFIAYGRTGNAYELSVLMEGSADGESISIDGTQQDITFHFYANKKAPNADAYVAPTGDTAFLSFGSWVDGSEATPPSGIPEGSVYLGSLTALVSYNYGDARTTFLDFAYYSGAGSASVLATAQFAVHQSGDVIPMVVAVPQSLVFDRNGVVLDGQADGSVRLYWTNIDTPSADAFSITSSASWLTIDNKMSDSFRVIPTNNNAIGDREATITIAYTGVLDGTVTSISTSVEVVQEGRDFKISPSWKEYLVSEVRLAEGEVVDFSLFVDTRFGYGYESYEEIYRGRTIGVGSTAIIDIMPIVRNYLSARNGWHGDAGLSSFLYRSNRGTELEFVVHHDYTYSTEFYDKLDIVFNNSTLTEASAVLFSAPISTRFLYLGGVSYDIPIRGAYFLPARVGCSIQMVRDGLPFNIKSSADSIQYYCDTAEDHSNPLITFKNNLLLQVYNDGQLTQSIEYTACDARSLGIVDEGRIYTLVYRNKLGGWDQLSVWGTTKRVDSISRESYMKARRASIHVGDEYSLGGGNTVFHTTITPTWELHTGFIFNERIPNNWHHLVESNDVYLVVMDEAVHNDGLHSAFIPVNITNTTLEYKTYRNSGRQVYSYTINVEQRFVLENW